MRYAIPLLLAIFSASCSTAPQPATVTVVNQGPMIARIVERHQSIIVRAGADGPTYSLATPSGEKLTPGMTIGQLAQKDPELFHKVRSLQDGVLWAGCDTGE
jgi:hypothetical protein